MPSEPLFHKDKHAPFSARTGSAFCATTAHRRAAAQPRHTGRADLSNFLGGANLNSDANQWQNNAYTEDDLAEMSLGELRSLATDLGLTVPKTTKKPALVKKVWDAMAEDEDEA